METYQKIKKLAFALPLAISIYACGNGGNGATAPSVNVNEKPVVKPQVLQAIKIVLNGKGEIAKPEHFEEKNLAGITNQQNYLITTQPVSPLTLYKQGTKIPVAELEKVLEEEQRYKYKVKNIDVSQLEEGKKLNLEKVINRETFNESQIERRKTDKEECEKDPKMVWQQEFKFCELKRGD